MVNLAFAAFLIYNSWQMVAGGGGVDEDLSDKWIVNTCRYARCASFGLGALQGSLSPLGIISWNVVP